MSKNRHHRVSTADASNAPITAPTPPPTQEKTMEASQPNTEAKPETLPLSPPEVSGPTAKELAAAEEQNHLRLRQQAEQDAKPVQAAVVPVADVAARGYEALHEHMRLHNEAQKNKKEYVPPPRTTNQMSRLQEELEAGAKAVERARAQQAASRPEPVDGNKEGFTTPVFRPNDSVPDPVTGKLGSFSPDV